MKALEVLVSKWDPIRQKLVRRLLEEQSRTRCYGPTLHKRGGQVKGFTARVGNMSSGTFMRERERLGVKGRVRKLSRAPGSLGVVLCSV